MTEPRCGDGLWSGPALRLARPDVMEEEEEELECWGPVGVGCVVRAREERRGDMTSLCLLTASQTWLKVTGICQNQGDTSTTPLTRASRCNLDSQPEVEGAGGRSPSGYAVKYGWVCSEGGRLAET